MQHLLLSHKAGCRAQQTHTIALSVPLKWSLWSFHYRKQVPPPVRRPPDLMFVNDVRAHPTLTRIHGRVAATSRACVCDANHANARTSRSLARLSVHVTYDPLHSGDRKEPHQSIPLLYLRRQLCRPPEELRFRPVRPSVRACMFS